MTAQEIIASGILESYVMGNASPEEISLVNKACKEFPEIIEEIERIESSLILLAESEAPELPSSVQSGIHGEIFKEARVMPLQRTNSAMRWMMAASVVLFVTSAIMNVMLFRRVSTLQREVAGLYEEKSVLADQMNVQRTKMEKMNDEVLIVTNPSMKAIALNGMKEMTSRGAMVHWNPSSHEVYFSANELPQLANGRVYQLWAIVNGQPVDAGVITGGDRNYFMKMKSISGASAFAITLEPAGGSPAPTLETMCFLGSV